LVNRPDLGAGRETFTLALAPVQKEGFQMRVRIGLVLLLGLLACGCSREKSTGQLLQDLKSGSEGNRVIAVRLLQQREGDAAQVVPAMIDALKDKEVDVRLSAAIGLGYFGEEANAAIPALQEALHDRDPRVKEAAGVALSRIEPDKFPPPTHRRQAQRK
jgi:HEAT repeats